MAQMVAKGSHLWAEGSGFASVVFITEGKAW